MSSCTVVILKYRGRLCSLVQKSRASKFVKEGGNGVVVMKVGEEFRTVRSHVQICVCTYPHYKLQDVHMNCTCDSCSLQSIEAILFWKKWNQALLFPETK
jgi:S-adenosylmethionine/arginine decarboxylase-like enzyme